MTETKVGQEFTSEILNTISKSQAAVVDAVETWASTVQSIKPELPELPFADKLPTSKLPTPQELVTSAYDFAEQLLASQRKFAEDLLKATAPVLSTSSNGAPKKAAKAS